MTLSLHTLTLELLYSWSWPRCRWTKGSTKLGPYKISLVAATIFAVLAPQRQLTARPLVAQMTHTSWLARDGAPTGIKVLVQAGDGVLWIGAATGLFTFDGFKFQAFQSPKGEAEMPAESVSSIVMARDRSMWIGFASGPLVRVDRGHVRIYETANGIDFGKIISIQQAPDGAMWVATQHHVWSLKYTDQWQTQPTPEDPFNRLFMIDRSGTLWLATNKGLYQKSKDQLNYRQILDSSGIFLALSENADGSLIVSDFVKASALGRTRLLDRDGRVLRELSGQDVLFASLPQADDTIWLATENHGLKVVSSLSGDSGTEGVFDRSTGLTSNIVHAVLQDRDGNIWAGTDNGLDRFKLPRLLTVDLDSNEQVWSICGGQKEALWLASQAGDLYKVLGSSVSKMSTRVEDILSLTCARNGAVLFVSRAGLWRVENGVVTRLPDPPGSEPYQTTQVLEMSDRSLIVVNTLSGIWHLENGKFSQLGTRVVQKWAGQVAFLDSHDRVWISGADQKSSVAVLGPDGTRLLDPGDPRPGPISVFLETSLGMLAGGRNGIAISFGGNFRKLELLQPRVALEVTGLIQSRDGDLWILGSRGVVRVGSEQLARAVQDHAFQMKTEIFLEDGVVGRSIFASGNKAVTDAKGRLWFAALNRVAWLDPRNQPPKPKLPLLSITAITADGKPLKSGNQFNPNPDSLEIDYLGVNLSTPESVVYRYRLSGVDSAWRDVGSRKEAIYTHLKPGSYVFHVKASNGDDVWTDALSSTPFAILPAYYQTWWFVMLYCFMTLSLMVFCVSVYVRTATSSIRARADERVRIAQDLHDTLLQGVHGLMLSVHVVGQTTALSRAERLKLDRALSAANDIIIEGRSRVSHLRSGGAHYGELENAFERVLQDLNVSGEVVFSVSRSGALANISSSDLLNPHIVDELFIVGREALTNAFRHANASEIVVKIKYGRSALDLSFCDNGIGLGQQNTRDLAAQDHWGVRGMNERVRQMGGLFRIKDHPQKGTEVNVSVPAIYSYKRVTWLRALAVHLLDRTSTLSAVQK